MTNDNEIIKALECCVQNTREACAECPIGFEGMDLCLNVAMEEAIDLINRQKTEIERLKCALHKYIDKDDIKEIEMYEALAETRVNAIKEFADSLHEKLYSIPTIYNSHFGRMVDNLVKEMASE